MTVDFNQAHMELDPGLFLRLDDAAGTTVDCIKGCLWITHDGCPADIQLQPGQRYCVADPLHVIVTAFEPSLAYVAAPAPCRRRVAHAAPALFESLARRFVHGHAGSSTIAIAPIVGPT